MNALLSGAFINHKSFLWQNPMSKKYRPYFSLSQLSRIRDLAFAPEDKEIYDAVNLILLKAHHGITQPSYTPIATKLGVPENMSPEEEQKLNETLMSQLSPKQG